MSEEPQPAAPDLLGPLASLPRWSQPPASQLDPDLPPADPTTGPLQDDNPPLAPTSPTPNTARGATLTRASSRAGADTASVAHLLAGLLTVLTGLLAWGVSKRGMTLRRPDDDELEDVAEPTARILARHVDVAALSPDLADLVQASAAVTDYALSEPLSRTAYAVVDIPPQPDQETP